MYLSISSYTESRKLSKAITRFYATFDAFQKEIQTMDIKNNPYKGIIITFVDEDEEYFGEILDKDRYYHVDVGISPNLTLLPNEDKKFFSYIYEKVDLVIEKSKLEQPDKKRIKDVLLNWKNSFGNGVC